MADAMDHLTSSTGTGTGKPFADICVVAHVDDDTGKLIAEIPEGERLPAAVLEQLACNAKLTGVVYDRKGKPSGAHRLDAEPLRPSGSCSSRATAAASIAGEPRRVSSPPHRAGVTRWTHQARQPGPSVLDLSPQIHHDGWQILGIPTATTPFTRPTASNTAPRGFPTTFRIRRYPTPSMTQTRPL